MANKGEHEPGSEAGCTEITGKADSALQQCAQESMALKRSEALLYTMDDLPGNPELARTYCKYLGVLILAGETVPEKFRSFLGGALLSVSQGGDANQAFGLTVGHRRKNDRPKEMALAYAVRTLIDQGRGVESAFAQVGAASNKSEDQIRKIYYRHKDKLG